MSVSPNSMFLGLSSQVGIDKLKRGLLLSTINVFRELQRHSIGRFFLSERITTVYFVINISLDSLNTNKQKFS